MKIILLFSFILFAWVAYGIETSQIVLDLKSPKYGITAERFYYTTNEYTKTPDGCIHFDNNEVCGSYTIQTIN